VDCSRSTGFDGATLMGLAEWLFIAYWTYIVLFVALAGVPAIWRTMLKNYHSIPWFEKHGMDSDDEEMMAS